MATKKQNRRHVVRRARRALNNNLNTISNLSQHKANNIRYGDGLSKRDLRETYKDEK